MRHPFAAKGENVAVEYRWGRNQTDQVPTLLAELVRRRVALIVAISSATAQSAKVATATIPIVFNIGDDPVRIGLVASLARPGGNVTGVNFFAGEVSAKRLDLLRQLVPTAARVAVLVNPTDATISAAAVHDLEPAARTMGLQIQSSQRPYPSRD
jgi:putative ABC transport system substrate-binding protein